MVDLRAQNFTEFDRLALGVWQLQGHEVFAGNRLDDPYRHQAERARQILGQVHHLRALDTRGGFDFVTCDHRTRRCSHHADFHAKILELFLNQAAGHFQRFGRHGFLANRQAVEQVHLRQFAVGEFGEQRLLAFLDHPVAARHIYNSGFNDPRRRRRHWQWHRLQVQLALRCRGQMVHIPLRFNRLRGHGHFPLAQGLLAHGHIFFDLTLDVARADQTINARTHSLGQLAP